MFYFLALNSGPFISGNDISIHPVIAFNSSNVYRSMHGTSDYNLFDSYLQEYIHVEETTQRQHFWKYSLLDIILLQHIR